MPGPTLHGGLAPNENSHIALDVGPGPIAREVGRFRREALGLKLPPVLPQRAVSEPVGVPFLVHVAVDKVLMSDALGDRDSHLGYGTSLWAARRSRERRGSVAFATVTGYGTSPAAFAQSTAPRGRMTVGR